MKAGAPAKYDTPEELIEAIDRYFESPPTKPVVVQGVQVDVPNITITGLAYHLGFESRQSFYDYEKRDRFSYIIKRARLFVENQYEFLLQHGNTTGAIFALKNMGWSDKQELDHTSSDGSMSPERKTLDDFYGESGN
jgi:hypothetical protein